ncbi:MAG: polysaccharide deacetylase family protein [bacterium]|nr:polysaccharide deacetylase family protein [bacterium]
MHYNKVPHGIMFHHFHGGNYLPSQGSVSADDFKKILEFVGPKRILPPAEWLDKLVKKALKPEDLCLTFDDGLLDQIEVALPILESLGLKAFWFVYSGVFSAEGGSASDGEGLENMELYRVFRTQYFKDLDDFYRLFFQKVSDSEMASLANSQEITRAVSELRKTFPFYSKNDAKFRIFRDKILRKQNYERIMDALLKERGVEKSVLAKNLWMNNRHLKYLAGNGHAVGLHSYSHPTALADLRPEEQLREYQKNYSHLEKVCGKKPTVMSHPCNSYSDDTLRILKQLGIACGFRSNLFPGKSGGHLNASDLEIAREDHANLMRAI